MYKIVIYYKHELNRKEEIICENDYTTVMIWMDVLLQQEDVKMFQVMK